MNAEKRRDLRVTPFSAPSQDIIVTCHYYALKTKDFSLLILSRGRGIRTPINGFGDRCSAVELFPFARFEQLSHRLLYISTGS